MVLPFNVAAAIENAVNAAAAQAGFDLAVFAPDVRPADPAYETLTRREQQVLRLLAEGRGAAEIAAGLYISRKTVENHRSNIFGKLGLSNLAELVHYAARMGLVDLDGLDGEEG